MSQINLIGPDDNQWIHIKGDYIVIEDCLMACNMHHRITEEKISESKHYPEKLFLLLESIEHIQGVLQGFQYNGIKVIPYNDFHEALQASAADYYK